MNTLIIAYDINHQNSDKVEVEIAGKCPVCNVALSPSIQHATFVEGDFEHEIDNSLFVLNYCPNCRECFVSRHIQDFQTEIFYLDSTAPTNYFKTSFTPNLSKLSPEFVKIYNDAAKAETLQMTSICGMGYRKALEFLVKDYCISNNPDATEEIQKLALARCIEKYIDDNRLKDLAKASAWLGNDETHYIKKHTDYGVKELKAYINAFVTFVDSDLAYKDAKAFIST